MPNETLLIVEDNDVLREGLQEMLTYEGYAVLSARNGVEALEKMIAVTPSLILSDIAMPLMDGIQFYNLVREKPGWVTIPFLFLTAKADPEDVQIGRNLGAEDYLTKPINREELVTTIHSRLSRSRQVQMAQLQQAYLGSLTALANAVDLRERNTSGHVERVAAYSIAMARQIGWKEWQLEQLRYAAILHDIGKIHISENILFKKGLLTGEDLEIVRSHAVTGAEMIKNIPFLMDTAPVVRHHHERWDGQGYPDGLSGEAIPEGARIVSIADAFDTMITVRPYSPARSLQEAYLEILSLSGERYDPTVVAAFQRCWYAGQIQSVASKR
jgi:putative two-component system response regulator